MAHRALWSGRFKEPLAAIALKFSSSIDLDKTLYQEDIAGSIAHVEMLSAGRIVTAAEARRKERRVGRVAGARSGSVFMGCYCCGTARHPKAAGRTGANPGLFPRDPA